MVIHIPNHLEKSLPIVKQLSDMIRSYSELYGNQDTLDSFDYYYTHYSSDSVKKFIETCLSKDDFEDLEYYEGVVSYLTKLFYSVKGTSEVFRLMSEHLGVKFLGEISYTINSIDFELAEVTTGDISVYIKTMTDFLSSLMYYGDLAVDIEVVNLKISEEISNYMSVGIQRYQEYTVNEVFTI